MHFTSSLVLDRSVYVHAVVCRQQLAAQGHQPAVQYITQDEFVGRAATKVAGLKKAQLPTKYAANPHAYLKKLNHVRRRS